MTLAITKVLLLFSLAVIATASADRRNQQDRREPIKGSQPVVAPDSRGEVISRGEFPWIVALLDKATRKYFCGGSLISATFVLSPAQCIHPKEFDDNVPREDLPAENITAVFGAHDLADRNDLNVLELSPTRIIIHEAWKPPKQDFDADLALLEFEQGKIIFSERIQRIPIWTTIDNAPFTEEGIVVGWTKTDDVTNEHLPKKLKLPIQTNEECFLTTKTLIYYSSRRTFCAGFRNFSMMNDRKLGVCRGDRGSGMVAYINKSPYMKGMVAMNTEEAESKCDVSRNAVFANVFKFGDWIVNNTQLSPEEFVAPPPKVKEVECSIDLAISGIGRRDKTCFMVEAVDEEETILGASHDPSVTAYSSENTRSIKFIPKKIGEKLPNLRFFIIQGCGLTIVRDFNFNNLEQLVYLSLAGNKISTIEAGAFKDLTNLATLDLSANKLSSLDRRIFENLANLQFVLLKNNKLRFLSPKTFEIPSAQLRKVSLTGNVCMNNDYLASDRTLGYLEDDLRAHCGPQRYFPRFK